MTATMVDRLGRRFFKCPIASSINLTTFAVPIEVEAWEGDDTYLVKVRMTVFSRDMPKELHDRVQPIEVSMEREHRMPPYQDNRDFKLHILHHMVREAVLHELDEHFYVFGERLWDPHRNDPPPINITGTLAP